MDGTWAPLVYEDPTVPEPWNVRIETNKPVSASLAERPALPRCPLCGGDADCAKHGRGWTEDGKTLLPRRAGLPQVAWMPYETVQKTGVTARVYGPAPGEDIGKE
jgi:hypothetical protein